jgi:hypothetical protein
MVASAALPNPENAFGRNSLTSVTLLCVRTPKEARRNIEKRRFNHSLIQHARCPARGVGEGAAPTTYLLTRAGVSSDGTLLARRSE